ncbi:iron-containing redox enzyme family protein [Nocardioides sp. TRM66260-LWL]|uniref:iron-containing redox enzyme family protein n=1 Tax=Nocardioides sp. TRM66260-LWL TaxID=2874478 RepID=UPI001CC42529|nr:iron-containing redox enzyme family protein [Nocardioides sp. TRM66260-LWL]MBZ5735273.1 iron-containing redox enzyme family protein [Nocardioides sp. TRM66260-LWL]
MPPSSTLAPAAAPRPPRLPSPRGPLGEAVVTALDADPEGLSGSPEALGRATREDRLLTLWTLQELHRGGFAGVEDDAEDAPGVVALRRRLEQELEARLRGRWLSRAEPTESAQSAQSAQSAEPLGPAGPPPGAEPGTWAAEAIDGLVAADDGPSLARFVQRRATRAQALELLRLRSLYHLQESDPVAWLVPRLPVVAKAALVELQYDEYGAGDPARLHHHLFARGLEACGVDAAYAAHVDEAPVEILEQVTTVTMLGARRRLRGAALGHLAAFEATSCVPSRRMAQGLRRLGLPEEIGDYYREHVLADAVHEQLASRVICGALLEAEPQLADDVLFGAWTCLDLEARFAGRLLDRWAAS